MTPVVLLHGVGLDHTMWDAVAPLLERPAVAYDLVGHGEGPHPPGPYRLVDFAEQFAAQRFDGPVDLVGFSMGALVAQRIALDHPPLVRRLVCVSGVFARLPEERAAIVERVADVRAGAYLNTIEPALERWFTSAFAAEQPGVVDGVRRRMLANDVRAYADAYEVFANADAGLMPVVGGIGAPTLVVTGGDDPRSTPRMAEQLAAALPCARAVVMPGLRHMIPLEAPSELAGLIRAFLDAEDDELC